MFTQAERIYLLTSSMAMLRSVLAGRDDTRDKIVANSVITKLLLSFDPGMRSTLIDQLQRSTQIAITLSDCPHTLQSVL